MKTYIEISRPSTDNMLTSQTPNIVSFIQVTWSKRPVLSRKNGIAITLLLLVCISLYFGCTLFSIIIVALFILSLGMVINEFIQYIRLIRDME